MVFASLGSSLLAIFLIDLEFQIIPDVITIPGMVVGLAVSLLPGGIGIGSASIGLLVGGGSLYLIALLGDWLFKKDSMGGGDIKMAAMLGAAPEPGHSVRAVSGDGGPAFDCLWRQSHQLLRKQLPGRQLKRDFSTIRPFLPIICL